MFFWNSNMIRSNPTLRATRAIARDCKINYTIYFYYLLIIYRRDEMQVTQFEQGGELFRLAPAHMT